MPAASTIYSQAKNENTYLMTGMNFEEFGAKSRKKYDKKSQDALNTDMYKTQNHMGATHEDLSAERVFMGFRNMEENRRFAKENRFLNQKSAIDEKFKDEDKILLEKYGARFGITPDECSNF
jgi:nicotinic acid phosphoribosyltransferase